MATIYYNNISKHFTHTHAVWHNWEGSKWSKLPIFSFLGQFDTLQKCKTTWIWVKCSKMLLEHDWAMTKIDLRRKFELRGRWNGKFSMFLKFPLYLTGISYTKYDSPAGGSNDLKNVRNIFSALLMIFVHRIKNSLKNLKKSVFLKHPTIHAKYHVRTNL